MIDNNVNNRFLVLKLNKNKLLNVILFFLFLHFFTTRNYFKRKNMIYLLRNTYDCINLKLWYCNFFYLYIYFLMFIYQNETEIVVVIALWCAIHRLFFCFSKEMKFWNYCKKWKIKKNFVSKNQNINRHHCYHLPNQCVRVCFMHNAMEDVAL